MTATTARTAKGHSTANRAPGPNPTTLTWAQVTKRRSHIPRGQPWTPTRRSRGPRSARLSPIPRRSRGQSRAARQPRHHVLALDSTTSCARLEGGPYARRHCMSTARVSAIPTPRSVTCRCRLRGRCNATRTSSSRSAYRTARPVAIRTLCDNNDNTIKQITVALGMGAPGNWHAHYLSRGGTPSWAKLHRPLRALAQSSGPNERQRRCEFE